MNFLQSDTFKKWAALVATINGALIASGVLPPLGLTICGFIASLASALGIVSGGTSGAQPKPLPPAP